MFFEFDYEFDAPPRQVWNELIDWKGHEQWIVSTFVELHGTGDSRAVGATFTAWSGPLPTTQLGRRLSLQDHMEVAELHYDAATETGVCRVNKLGPTLGGSAGFTVAPRLAAGTAAPSGGTTLTWTEDVTVALVPNLLTPMLRRIGIIGFRFSFGRLARHLRKSSLAG